MGNSTDQTMTSLPEVTLPRDYIPAWTYKCMVCHKLPKPQQTIRQTDIPFCFSCKVKVLRPKIGAIIITMGFIVALWPYEQLFQYYVPFGLEFSSGWSRVFRTLYGFLLTLPLVILWMVVWAKIFAEDLLIKPDCKLTTRQDLLVYIFGSQRDAKEFKALNHSKVIKTDSES